MTPFGVRIASIVVVTGMFYFVLWRFFVLFHNNSKIIPLIISVILAGICIWAFFYQSENKVIDIISTLAGRLFVLSFLLFLILIIEYVVSIWYKINPWIVFGVLIVMFGLGTFFALHTKIINLDIETGKVSKDTKILLVSDIHAENIIQDLHVKKIIKTIEEEKPDFVIIAGDLMNKPNTDYIDHLSAFNNIKDIPIFAVKGNHDIMGNGTIVNEIPKNSGIIILDNNVSTNNSLNIQVAGIIDKSAWGSNSLNDIMNQVEFSDDDLFTILVTHQPISLEKLQDYPIDLEVAGHTHRGQFYGMRKVVEWVNDYAYGEYKLGDRIAFVTQGIGTWGLPFRLGTQSEIVIINLKKK